MIIKLFALFILSVWPLVIKSTPPDWTPVSNLQYNMNITAKLQLSDGSYSINENDLVAAFVGDECRGVISPVAGLDGLLFLTVGSNQLQGETITFKAYIDDENTIVELEQTLMFVNQTMVGTPGEPFIFTYSQPIEFFNVVFYIADQADNVIVDAVVTFNNTDYPSGQYTIENVAPGIYDYEVNKQGYQSASGQIEVINENVEVHVVLNELGTPPDWTPIPNLQYTMNVIAKLQLADGTFAQNTSYMVGAFVAGECRGVASPATTAEGLIFLSIGSNQISGELINFQAYLAGADEIVDLNESIVFEANSLVGSIGNEFIFTIISKELSMGISHQAVIRDANNDLVAHSPIGIQVSILQGSTEGNAVYAETHTPVSNANGLITFIIGEGDMVTGQYAEINWAEGPYFLKMEADPLGGTNYSISGVSKFHTVPYSLHAKSADTVTGAVNETDPVFLSSPAAAISSQNIENWNNVHGWSNHIVVLENGNVGIGTTDPQSLLSVNGKITATEIEVTIKGWNAKAFDSNGKRNETADIDTVMNIGEISHLLMQKIEELSKNILELQRTNNALETRIQELERMIESMK